MHTHTVQSIEMERDSRRTFEEGHRTGAPAVDGQRRCDGVRRNANDPMPGDAHAEVDAAAAHHARHRGPGETVVSESDRQMGDQGRQRRAGEEQQEQEKSFAVAGG